MMPAERDDVNDVARNITESMINHVANLHSGNAPMSPMLTSPLIPSTVGITAIATTATIAATANVPPARMLLQETPDHAPMSEEIGEMIFSQGYDNDGLIAEHHPEQDLIELENCGSVEIGVCEGDTVPELAPAIAASRFVLVADSEMKKLKVDELRRELKNRGVGTGGLKKDLQARLKRQWKIEC